MEREDIQQSQIPKDIFDESSQDALINSKVVLLEGQNESAVPEEQTPPNQQSSTLLTPAAPKNSRKSTTGKGKQPRKKQKLQFADDEDSEEHQAEDARSTSLGKLMFF